MDIERMLEEILRREGSKYTDDPLDKGGPTRYGITQATLASWRGHDVEPYDVATLKRDEALEIYRSQYVRPFQYLEYPPLLGLVVDCGVNHGVRRATRWIQDAAGVTPDGVAGPRTRAAVLAADPTRLYCQVLATRARFYGRIITDTPSQARFAAGWCNRLAEFIDRKDPGPAPTHPATSQAPAASS